MRVHATFREERATQRHAEVLKVWLDLDVKPARRLKPASVGSVLVVLLLAACAYAVFREKPAESVATWRVADVAPARRAQERALSPLRGADEGGGVPG